MAGTGARTRRSLGIAEDAWIIASLGFVTQSKRISRCWLHSRSCSIMPNAIYLIVGEDHESGAWPR
ncbi:MAG: hypothetical protein IPL01_17440 [Acidobacteria bacterium]|nr:hypothetical protein [Acidobacteriota bacterium]